MNGMRNLITMYNLADDIDRREGKVAYPNYQTVMLAFVAKYGAGLDRVTAAFVAMSPNNDYIGNLRSLTSVLEGIRHGIPCDRIATSAYGHCKQRAYGYLTGAPINFEGPKISAFYRNILDPSDPTPVTVDGHIVGCWRGTAETMKQLIVRRKVYNEIAADIRSLAIALGLISNQLQATLWFARKRTLRIKYNPQIELGQEGNIWKSLIDLRDVPAYRIGDKKDQPEQRKEEWAPLLI